MKRILLPARVESISWAVCGGRGVSGGVVVFCVLCFVYVGFEGFARGRVWLTFVEAKEIFDASMVVDGTTSVAFSLGDDLAFVLAQELVGFDVFADIEAPSLDVRMAHQCSLWHPSLHVDVGALSVRGLLIVAVDWIQDLAGLARTAKVRIAFAVELVTIAAFAHPAYLVPLLTIAAAETPFATVGTLTAFLAGDVGPIARTHCILAGALVRAWSEGIPLFVYVCNGVLLPVLPTPTRVRPAVTGVRQGGRHLVLGRSSRRY